jgi:subtilase family serine protease
MSLLERFLRTPRPRCRRSMQCLLEGLEIRTAPAGSPMAMVSGGVALRQVMEPTFERIQLPRGETAALGIGKTEVQPEGWGTRSPSGYTPAQLRSAYGVESIRFSSAVGDGGGQTIAIVDAYDDPDLIDTGPGFSSSDLAEFDQKFGLPDPPSFIKVNEYGSTTNLPGVDPAGAGNPQGNWEVEEALDVEWAHAMAPGANIVLVECNSSGSTDMFQGIVAAAGLSGVSVVSMSWGSSEFNGETSYDADFTTPKGHQGVTFVASTGDQGSPGEFPAYSPNVLAVGGTSLYLSANGSYGSEGAWSGSGGGTSIYETEPVYQAGVAGSAGRSIPDVSFDADPSTGVAVYDSYNGTDATPWEQLGGTSVSAPTWAGLIAIADQGRVASGSTTLNGESQTLPAIYSISNGDFHDVTTGGNGEFQAGPGYDEVTGLGSPRANLLVNDLAAYGLAAKLVVSAEPQASLKAGGSFGFSVLAEDASGAVEQNFNGNITVALANNAGGGALGGTLTAMAQNGIATFSGLTLDVADSGYTLIATSGGVGVTTSPFNVTPAVPAKLALISQPPMRIGVNQAFGVSVAVEDRFGNLESTYSGKVSLSLASGPSGVALSGTLTLPVQDGVAVFGNLTLNRVGLGYSIKVASHDAIAATKTTLFGVVPDSQIAARAHATVVRTKPSVKLHRHVARLVRHA